MKKILCPTDFSETAHNAIAYAAKFAKATGGSLTLLHVQSFPILSAAIFPSEKDQLTNSILEKLQEISNEVWRYFKITCDFDLTENSKSLAAAITKKETTYDLIIMGTNGTEDLSDFFLGSNSYKVARKSNIPVLLVPANYIYCEIQRVLYPYNYVAERKLPIEQLQDWTKRLNCELTVLQVNEEAYSQDVEDEMKELQFILTEKLQQKDVSVYFDSIRTSEVAQGIDSYMHRNEFDLLTLCTSHHHTIADFFNPRVIKFTSGVANYPVLVFHQ